jgi:phosphonate transport system ATP-binding protein
MELKLDACSAGHPAARDGAAPALRTLTLHIRAGEQVAVIGPSGAGKTTFLHLLACALRPSAGNFTLSRVGPEPVALRSATPDAAMHEGVRPWDLSTAALQTLRGSLFLAPQVPPLPPRQRVVTAVLAGRLPHISLWTALSRLFYPRDMALAQTALGHFDLAEKLFERVDRLSGGERQRVGLARALVGIESGARLLLVDEPLSALDPERGRLALHSLSTQSTAHGATLVCTLHHVEMALQHFPRIIGLRDGELAFDLPATEVTPERLHALYASHMDELTGPAPQADFELNHAAAPVAMHCR